MASRIELRYKPQGKVLEEYIVGKERREFIMGPLGSGKTNASCWKTFRIMCQQLPNSDGVRKSRICAVRNTYPDLMGTTVKDWLDMFGEDFGHFTQGGLEPPTHRLSFSLEDDTTVEAELVFLALDRPEHVRKIRGLQLTAAWLNEVKELQKAIVDMLDLRVGRYPPPSDGGASFYGIYGDTNAPDEDHWYYILAEEDDLVGWKFHKQAGGVLRIGEGNNISFVENPDAENLINLPKGYYQDGLQGKSMDWIKVNLANEYGFVSDGKPVYPDYKDNVHCKEFDTTPNLPIRIGMDFGLTPAAIFSQQMPNGQWRHDSELVTERAGIIRFAELVKRHLSDYYPQYKVGKVTGDPSGNQAQGGDEEERTVFKILAANGIECIGAHTNDPTIRREAMTKTLRGMIDGEPAVLIHPRCKMLRKGMAGGFCYKRVQMAGEARFRDMPDKNKYSHICEATEYNLMGSGEGRAIVRNENRRDLPTFAIDDYSILG